ncbi:GTP cyclohydrolase II [Candidatus Poriferisodalis sp.]|uniref:GTP cyclohydrolase II n=1 Tax=Candidatus Poriferisodalis sp. TaxID=3101277 RepID=UPI003B02BBFB
MSTAPDDTPHTLERVGEAKLPTKHGLFTIFAYTGEGAGEHVALVFGDPHSRRGGVPVRMHSSCVTGDVFGSLRCDCGQQLELAIQHVTSAGAGAILYLDQEGRGIGLANKIRAYECQDAGFDTVDANTTLGFEADQRDYAPAAWILRDLGIADVELLTNNPHKAESLREHGIAVERVPLAVVPNLYNHRYLETKARRLGHQLPATNGHDPAWSQQQRSFPTDEQLHA